MLFFKEFYGSSPKLIVEARDMALLALNEWLKTYPGTQITGVQWGVSRLDDSNKTYLAIIEIMYCKL